MLWKTVENGENIKVKESKASLKRKYKRKNRVDFQIGPIRETRMISNRI